MEKLTNGTAGGGSEVPDANGMRGISAEPRKLLAVRSDMPEAAECLAVTAADPDAHCDTVSQAPTAAIRDVYAHRAEINEQLRGGVIRGFPALLHALSSTGDAEVKIHGVKTPAATFVVVPNPATSVLNGVLVTPRGRRNPHGNGA